MKTTTATTTTTTTTSRKSGRAIKPPSKHDDFVPQQRASSSTVEGIVTPHDNDVLLGRGGGSSYNHVGNQRYRHLVGMYKAAYKACRVSEKKQYPKIIVRKIRALNPPGRFLKQDMSTKLWHKIGKKKSLDKTQQALRELGPDHRSERIARDLENDVSPSHGRSDDDASISSSEQEFYATEPEYCSSAPYDGSQKSISADNRLTKIKNIAIGKMNKSSRKYNSGKWTKTEHKLFLKALQTHGKQWQNVAAAVKTRTAQQVRDHASRHFPKLTAKSGGELKDIVAPHDHDVLCGRGLFAQKHSGNKRFRTIVNMNKAAYKACKHVEKGDFPKTIVDKIWSLDPPGRFLKQDQWSGLWNDIGAKEAIRKTQQALREGQSDEKTASKRWMKPAYDLSSPTECQNEEETLAATFKKEDTSDLASNYDSDVTESALFRASVDEKDEMNPVSVKLTEGVENSDLHHIVVPRDHDVLSGRGHFTNKHPGNQRYRSLVTKYKGAHKACGYLDKCIFPNEIVNVIRNLDPPGRFLKQDFTSKLWHDIGMKKTLEKTQQALREGASEIPAEPTTLKTFLRGQYRKQKTEIVRAPENTNKQDCIKPREQLKENQASMMGNLETIICDTCGSADDEGTLLLCDGCNAARHMACCIPSLTKVPEGDWFCGHSKCNGRARACNLGMMNDAMETTQEQCNTKGSSSVLGTDDREKKGKLSSSPWSSKDIESLRKLVEQYNDSAPNWNEISTNFRHHNATACLTKWQTLIQQVATNMTKSDFSSNERCASHKIRTPQSVEQSMDSSAEETRPSKTIVSDHELSNNQSLSIGKKDLESADKHEALQCFVMHYRNLKIIGHRAYESDRDSKRLPFLADAFLDRAVKKHLACYFEADESLQSVVNENFAKRMTNSGLRFLLPEKNNKESCRGNVYQVVSEISKPAQQLIQNAFMAYHTTKPGLKDVVVGQEVTSCNTFFLLIRDYLKTYRYFQDSVDCQCVIDLVIEEAYRMGHRFINYIKENSYYVLYRRSALIGECVLSAFKSTIFKCEPKLMWVKTPHENDVLLGRGQAIFDHPGNSNFREIVRRKRGDYHSIKYSNKRQIAFQVINLVQTQKPRGRFLVRKENGYWIDAPCDKVLEKTCQALRERKWRPSEEEKARSIENSNARSKQEEQRKSPSSDPPMHNLMVSSTTSKLSPPSNYSDTNVVSPDKSLNWAHAATSYNSKRKSLAEFKIGDSTPKRARQGSKESPWHMRGQQHYESRSNNNATFGDLYYNDNGEPFSNYADQLAHQTSVESTYHLEASRASNTINGEWDELVDRRKDVLESSPVSTIVGYPAVSSNSLWHRRAQFSTDDVLEYNRHHDPLLF